MAILHPLWAKVFKSETTSFHFSRIWKIKKSLDIGLREVGAKRLLNGGKKGKQIHKKNTLRRFYTIFKQKCLHLRPLISITFPQGFQISKHFGHRTLGSRGKKTLNGTSKVNNFFFFFIRKKNFCRHGNFRPFLRKNVKIWDLFFSLLFPKDSESLKILDIQLQEDGGNKTFKRYLKKWTDKHTNTRTDGQTHGHFDL